MIAYLDCFAGASGDMLLAALVDAGADLELMQDQLTALNIPFELIFDTVHRCGLRALKAEVSAPEGTTRVMRTYDDALRLLDRAALDPRVASRAGSIFTRLAKAEAKVHGVATAEVHFHELDAVDTVVDVVGSAAAFVSLGLDAVYVSPVATGIGMVPSRHGPLPLPAPAVLELLGGARMVQRSIEAELITPTGAAIIAEFATGFGKMPAMSVTSVGYGAGSWELEIPNVLRVVVGHPGTTSVRDLPEAVEDLMVEATIDDMNPELYPYVLDRLFEAGAVDAWVTPVIGKHGRPAQILSVIVPPVGEERVREVLVTETTTLGVRVTTVRRWMLPRRWLEVTIGGHPVRVKVGTRDGLPVNVAPEHADCAAAARALGLPLKDVYREAMSAASLLL